MWHMDFPHRFISITLSLFTLSLVYLMIRIGKTSTQDLSGATHDLLGAIHDRLRTTISFSRNKYQYESADVIMRLLKVKCQKLSIL